MIDVDLTVDSNILGSHRVSVSNRYRTSITQDEKEAMIDEIAIAIERMAKSFDLPIILTRTQPAPFGSKSQVKQP